MDLLSGFMKVSNEKKPKTWDSEIQKEYKLSDSELRVLKKVCTGQPHKDTAKQLNLGETTIKYHLTHIFKKLDVKSRSQLAVTVHDFKLLISETNKTITNGENI